ncbi:MAG: hypothetical protein M1837_001455 [Sclerophora amabilis]|nr:MAG: hypothetical protein M1837_001455 [Sclerophora amabilis]
MDSLEGILSETLDAFKHVYLVLDALDECPKLDGNRERVLKVIRRILGRCNEQVHILATSRREADIEKVMTPLLTECTGSSICVQSAVNEDIKLYTSSHLESWKFSSWPNNIKQEVESVLTAQADGMFRWVACQLDLLQDLSQPSTIRKALRSLPKTLDATYDRMLQSISDDCQDQAIAALKWLTFSARPLSVTELADAVVVNHLNDPPFDPDDRLFDPLRILDFLPGLVVVSSVGDGGEDKQQIRLAHFSVKEYLLSPRIRVSPASAFSMIEIEAHTFIAETCLAYQLQVSNSEFSMIEIEAHTFIAETCLAYHLQGSNSATSLVRLLQKFPLLPYAALYWVQHATMTDSRSWNASVSQLCIELLRSRGSFINWVRISRGPMFFTIKPRPETESRYIATKLYYAARHDLLPAVDWLLGNGADVNAQDEINGTALHVASGNGHVAVVERLLKDGADVNAHLGYFNNALQAASGKGHEALTERLLRDEAHVNAQGGIHETALHVASGNGHLAVVERLLKSGADVNARGGIRGTPLQVASGRGHMAVVEQLLKGGADVNAQGGFYDNALQAASGNGHVAVVERLLRNGADVNAQGGHCGNALVAASCYGNEAVVERLLKGGADVHASGRGYGNALEAASARGHDAIVERLREYSTRAGRRRDST